MLHAVYVAFVFSCLYFGALGFRQIADNLVFKKFEYGEDRELFLDPLWIYSAIALAIASLGLLAISLQIESPAVFHYAFPLILLIQATQIFLRQWFQRTRVKTIGVLTRSMFAEHVQEAPYQDLIAVVVRNQRFWSTVLLMLPSNEIRFRIFPSSKVALLGIIRSSTSASIMETKSE